MLALVLALVLMVGMLLTVRNDGRDLPMMGRSWTTGEAHRGQG